MEHHSNSTVRRADPFLVVLLAASLAVNVWLAVKLRAPHDHGESAPALQAGQVLPPFQVTDRAARPVSLGAGSEGGPAILYVYSRSCRWCDANEPAVESLASQQGHAYRFLGLCIDSPHECAAPGGPTFPTYSGIEPEVVRRLGLGVVPQTIVASGDGTVSQVWRGAWVDETRRAVEDFFGVRLPAEEGSAVR